MRPHRHQLLPEISLKPTSPIRDVSLDGQSGKMRELRAAQNQVADGYRERDALMAAWALSNTLSRQDMAVATGLAKSRVDQIIREYAERDQAIKNGAAAERVARHSR